MKKFKNIFNKRNNQGFTILEVMVAAALFVVVMLSGVTAVLNSNSLHKKTQNQRNILDNLSFVMEDMSRNLMTGTSYRCPAGVSSSPTSTPGENSFSGSFISFIDPQDCDPGDPKFTIAFEAQDGDVTDSEDQFVYYISNGRIYKSTNSGKDFFAVTPPEITVDGQKSGFAVVGSLPRAGGTGDKTQPRVIIRISGTIKFKGTDSPFSMQTTVSQRFIDA